MTDPNAPFLPTITAEDHQRARLDALPPMYTQATERMACELALEMEDPADIFRRYGYSEEQAVAVMESTSFAALLARVGKEVRESGLSFRTKAKAQAEELLGHSFEIATDPNAPTSERVKLIQWTARVAGLEPKEKDEGAGRGGFTLNLTFAGEAPQKVVSGAERLMSGGALTIDQED